MQADALAVLVQPAAKRRPLSDEHLVGDLGRAVTKGHQTSVRELVQKRLDRVRRGARRDELVDAHAPAGVLDALPELGEPEEHVADQPPPVVGSATRRRVGRPGDRRRDAAALAVALDRQRAPVAPLPGGAQRVREQRQRPRLARRRRAGPGRPGRARVAARPVAPARSRPAAARSSVIGAEQDLVARRPLGRGRRGALSSP